MTNDLYFYYANYDCDRFIFLHIHFHIHIHLSFYPKYLNFTIFSSINATLKEQKTFTQYSQLKVDIEDDMK